MKMLLMKYGHGSMVFMDATHKFTKYKEASLFYIAVKTNEGFKVSTIYQRPSFQKILLKF